MLVMFGVALGLRGEDFRALGRRPGVLIGGVFTQVVMLPAMTFALLHIISPPASIALGMIVVACCPGGSVSNLLTYLSRGDVAVSVSLTAISSLLAALLTPLSTLFWSNAYGPTAQLLSTLDVNPMLFVIQTAVLLLLPLVAGMAFAARWPDIALAIRRKMTLAGSAVLGLTIIYGIIYFFPVLWPAVGLLLSITIVHNAAAFLTGATAGLLLARDSAVRRALTFEVGIQNSGLALIILLAQLEGVGGAAAIAAVWGVWHIIAGSLLAFGYRHVVDRRHIQQTT